MQRFIHILLLLAIVTTASAQPAIHFPEKSIVTIENLEGDPSGFRTFLELGNMALEDTSNFVATDTFSTAMDDALIQVQAGFAAIDGSNIAGQNIDGFRDNLSLGNMALEDTSNFVATDTFSTAMDDTLLVIQSNFVSTSTFNDAIGDIDTALDVILGE